MTPYLVGWIATAVVLLAIDAVWLGLVATSFYRRELGDLMLDQPKLLIAAIFYIGYAAAIVVLASMPAAKEGSLGLAFVLGAVLGLAAYGTYDITNLATLKNWPIGMSLVDLAWGALLTATSATAGCLAIRWLT